MIATLRGKISEKIGNLLVLDVNGLGYGIFATLEDVGRLPSGEEAKFYIFENIKEDAHDLYGFSTLSTKALFELLLSVSGVGPKMALAILNIGTESRVKQSIASGDLIAAIRGFEAMLGIELSQMMFRQTMKTHQPVVVLIRIHPRHRNHGRVRDWR